jgi:hypothetical protein
MHRLFSAIEGPPPTRVTEDHLRIASGYLDLGMLEDAEDELDLIPDAEGLHPDVMRFKARIHFENGRWALLKIFASMLVQCEPQSADHWMLLAFATRRCESAEDAAVVLAKALSLHPQNALIYYHLSVYAALSKKPTEASKWLAQAIRLDTRLGQMALDDPDLATLWDSLAPA